MLFDGFVRRASAAGEFGTREIGKAADARVPRAKLGLALGGGAAKGWSHIGVLRALDEAGIRPDIIVGCSIGAVVGGCYAAGKLDQVEAFARSLTKRRVVGLLDLHLGGSGLIGGGRVRRLLDIDLAEQRVEDLPIRFATVATELRTGHEIWLTRGPLVDAMRASYALPGVFSPVKMGGRWLVDGALVNPVPVSIARGLGADVVICVNLNGDVRLRSTVVQTSDADGTGSLVRAVIDEPRTSWLFRPFREGAGPRAEKEPDAPSISGVMTDAFNIMQDRISRSRLAGDPPDVMIVPKTAGIGLFEFHRAAECIEIGVKGANRALPEIRDFLAAAGIGLAAPPAAPAQPAGVQPAVM